MTALRGSTMNSHSYETDQGVPPAQTVRRGYHCPVGHVTTLRFSVEADEIPATWDCPKCGRLAHHDSAVAAHEAGTPGGRALASPRTSATGKTHWEMLLERRTLADLEVIFAERLSMLRARRP
jgi:RNA polymerase-binding protein